MSELLRLVNSLTTRRNGNKIQYGSTDSPYEMAMSHDLSSGFKTIAASGNAELFDGSETDPFTTASIIWIRSDRDLSVQLTFDTAGVAGKVVQTYYVLGGGDTKVMGPPLLLADARAYANYTEDFAAGTLYYCDRVLVLNEDSSNSAYVEFFIGD